MIVAERLLPTADCLPFPALRLHIAKQLAGSDAANLDINHPVRWNLRPGKDNIQIICRQRHRSAFFLSVQRDRWGTSSHLRCQKGLALRRDDVADFLTAFASHATVHLLPPWSMQVSPAGPRTERYAGT